MQTYQVITTVDITNPRVARHCSNRILAGQQSNFNSLIQAINMRSNITWRHDPTKHTGGLPWPADGRATHWLWEFDTERDAVFANETSPVGLLLADLDNVPIIPDLENSVDFFIPVFKPLENIWICEIA